MSRSYLLNRDQFESQRLEVQHKVWTRNLGYSIHPTIAQSLPANSRIADVGTGTGIWLLDLATDPAKGKPGWQFDGFDISSAQYPPPAKLPQNVRLHEADFKAPFAPEHLEQFDVVHLRLVVLAMDAQDWHKVLANVKTLLKPRGWVQWEEIDIECMFTALRGNSSTACPPRYLQLGIDHIFDMVHSRARHYSKNLYDAFASNRMQNVVRDTVASDRIPELRSEATKAELGILSGLGKQQLEDAVPGAWPLDKLEEVMQGINREVDAGGYLLFYVRAVIGQVGLE